MKNHLCHEWNISPAKAADIQKELAQKVIFSDNYGSIKYIAGIDVGFPLNKNIARAAVVILDYANLRPVDYAVTEIPVGFPYIPGLLSFREIPVILKVFKKINVMPDIILCDGQGIAHPRRFGLASHLGIMLDIPAIGVAKSKLYGKFGPVPNIKGRWAALYDPDNEIIGAVLRTRQHVKPLYISCGHRISLSSAIQIVMKCITRYRLPETSRYAHQLASNKKPAIKITGF
jgi:deoxyribonuclease V